MKGKSTITVDQYITNCPKEISMSLVKELVKASIKVMKNK